MKKVIITLLLAGNCFLCFSQALTVAQLRLTLHKNASQITNYLTTKGWNYYRSIDSAEVKALFFTYGLNRNDYGYDSATFWYSVAFDKGAIYSVSYSFGDHKIYIDIIKQLELLKVKRIDEKITEEKIKIIYCDDTYFYILSTLSRKGFIPFDLEIQPINQLIY